MKGYTSTVARLNRQVQQEEKHPNDVSAYLVRRADKSLSGNFEGISLNRDGTYSRTIVDQWGRSYGQQGTWRDYGEVGGKHIELDGYSEARDVVSRGGPQNAPKGTKSLGPGEYFVR